MLIKIFFTSVVLLTVCTGARAQSTNIPIIMLGKVSVSDPVSNPGIKFNAIGTREDILADPQVHITVNGKSLPVTQFTISFLPAGGEYFGPFNVTGADIPHNFTEKLKSLATPEGMVYVESLRARTPDGHTRLLKPIIMKMVAASNK